MNTLQIKSTKDEKTAWLLEGNEDGKWIQIGPSYSRHIDAQKRFKDYSENLKGLHEFRLVRLQTTIERIVESD